MSAYIVDREHVAYLVNMALDNGRWGGVDNGYLSWYWKGSRRELRAGDYDEGVRIGEMLWNENGKSVQSRYAHRDSGPLPGEPADGMEFTRKDLTPWGPRFNAAQVLKSCDCYEYQSCEHEGWKDSEAFAFIDALRRAAWSAMPGYKEAAWGAPGKVNA